nr:Fe-S cluster assembly protein SufB [Candidatus Woesebacteria bacterium]
MKKTPSAPDLDLTYRYGFSMDEKPFFKTRKGLTADIVKEISAYKKEPKWMTDFRLKAFDIYKESKMPSWGADLSDIPFDDIVYFATSTEKQMDSWEDLPSEIKDTYDRIGVPQAE